MQTPNFPRCSYNQAIRSRSDLPDVEAFDEERSKYDLLAQVNMVMR